MKQITIYLADGYEDVVSVTAIGRDGMITNVSTGAYTVSDGETLYFPENKFANQTKEKVQKYIS